MLASQVDTSDHSFYNSFLTIFKNGVGIYEFSERAPPRKEKIPTRCESVQKRKTPRVKGQISGFYQRAYQRNQ